MNRMRTVKEVSDMTGVSTKIINDYAKKGIIPPSGYRSRGYTDRKGKDYTGYKVYDEAAVMKFHQVATYRKLKMKRSVIEEKLNSTDSSTVLKEQIEMLKKEREQLEDRIAMVEFMQAMGTEKNFFKFYSWIDVNKMAENIQRWEKSEYYKELCDIMEYPSDEFWNELDPVLEELSDICDEIRDSKVAEKLLNICVEHYGWKGFIIVLMLTLIGQGGGELAKELSDSINDDTVKRISDIMMKQILQVAEKAWQQLLKILAANYNSIGKKFEEESVKNMVSEIRLLLFEFFGVQCDKDYQMIFEYMLDDSDIEDRVIRFVIDALKYYHLKGEENVWQETN